EIKVLGTGCPTCHTLEKNVLRAVDELGNNARVEKVWDIVKILEYKILRTPALVIDEQVVVSGRVPDVAELKEIILKHSM
ncbi:MAG TPA: thioredoxin family protein, partial [Bacteroidales bacterium]|nr:thioredoxin family protein [Bacteroidales bacterium]